MTPDDVSLKRPADILLPGIAAILWLAAVPWIISPASGLLAFVGILVLGVAVWEGSRGHFGSAVAWAWCATGAVACEALFALPLIHLYEIFGGAAGCDPMAMSCDPQPVQIWLGHMLPLICFVVAGVLMIIQLRRYAREEASV